MLNPLQVLQELNESSSFLQPLAFTLLAIFLIFLYTCYSSTKTTTQKSSPPPSPPKLPIIGNLHQIGLYPHLSLQALSQRYGPLMLLHFGSVPVLVVSSAEAAREILKTHDLAFSDRPKSTIFEKLLYNYRDVASAPYGEYWRQVKSICVLNLLSNRRVRSFRSVREEETKSMIRNIKDSSSSSVLNLSEMFVRLTNDVVCRVALGRKYSEGEGGESGRMFKEILGEFADLLGIVNIGDYVPWLSWLSQVNGLGAKLDKVAKQLDDFIDTVVQEHMNHSSRSGDDDQKNFLDVLLAIQKENLAGIPIDRVSIKAIILDMFAAGTDSTYTALEWTMTELLRHPRVMNKLQNEVRGIVGNKTDVITEDDLVEMHYLKAVTKETLRLHPPLPLLVPRMSTRDVEVNGYNIKANTQVFISAWQIGRDPKLYDKPEEYEPERFLNNGIDYKGNDFELIPFGAGRRACPGIQFAMAVNEIALANIVHKFDWALPGEASREDLDMTESTGLTSHKKYPLKAVAFPHF
ncbi:cytochrome P450 71A26-like isoform X1 [Prunus avium]|uniref:Cytochrome P450 71A26-like isoform X1 n=1 Tax=Prunus avium TaxID=42229 RepID=A0A6P5RYU5_PRUAV|nr:cytochrome P450 71A26-like isoform X1 [Prunus avium]